MNAGEGDCRYISTLYGAYTMAGRVVYRQQSTWRLGIGLNGAWLY